MSIPTDHRLVAGDVIAISAVLEFSGEPGDPYLHARIGHPYGERISVERSAATLVQAHLAVGDRVRHAFSPDNPDREQDSGKIVAIVGDCAWVAWDDGPGAIFVLRSLRRICTVDATELALKVSGG